mmetsp:Transcript_40587/g.73356  ORF Transcript_40587/g.73356 Transcript_40587/m.73356 type:complete len:383 (-) Transcript_40587:129-1277(-)
MTAVPAENSRVESLISLGTDDLVTEATSFVAKSGGDFQVLDATESVLHRIMQQRRLALKKTMKDLPEDEVARVAHGAREEFLLKSMASEVTARTWKDILTTRAAVEARLQVLKDLPRKQVPLSHGYKDAAVCLHAMDACLLISMPAYDKKRYNIQRLDKGNEGEVKSNSTQSSAAQSVVRKKRYVLLGFISAAEEVTHKVAQRNLGVRFASHWAGKNPQVSYVRPRSQADKLGIQVGDMLVSVDRASLTTFDYAEKIACLRTALMQLEAKPPAHNAYSLAVSFVTSEHALSTKHFTQQPLGIEVGKRARCGLCSVGARVTNVGFDGEALDNDIEAGWLVQSIDDEVVERWPTDRIATALQDAEQKLPEAKVFELPKSRRSTP